MKSSVLFIGSFLSRQKGSKGVIEKLVESDLSDDFRFLLASSYENLGLRLFEMIFKAFIFRGNYVHIDVYSGNAFIYADILSRLARFRNKTLIMTLHGGGLPEYTDSRKQKVLRVLSRANILQSPSKYLIRYYQDIGLKRIDYLPNPIDLQLFPYDRNNIKQFSLLWVRAFASIYNPKNPIRVLSSVLREYPQATLTMVGPDKGELENVKALARELGLENQVTFTGSVPNDMLYNYYQSHHIYLNTPSFESFGVAVVEAAACGIPIVSNSVGEIPLLWIDNYEILLAQENSVNQFVELIFKLFESQSLCKALSINAHKKAIQFDWENIKPIWHKLLSSKNV